MIVRKTTSIFQKMVECLTVRLIYQELFLLVTFYSTCSFTGSKQINLQPQNPFNGWVVSIGQAEAHKNRTSINKKMSS